MALLKLTDIAGVGDITAKKLLKQGINTVQAVAEADVAQICTATGFPVGRSEAIQQAAAVMVTQLETISPDLDIKVDIGKKKKKGGKKKKDGKKKKKDGKKKKGGKKKKDGKKKKKK